MSGLKRVSSLCACCMLLAMLRSTRADPVGLVTFDVTDATAQSLGLSVCNVFAQFDNPTDTLISIGFTYINTNAPGGFHQHSFGGDTAPSQIWVDLYPELAYDSFVTIGVMIDDGSDATTLDLEWDSCAFNCIVGGSCGGNNVCGETAGGWFNVNPKNDQGTPNSFGLVPIAQFTINQGPNRNVSGHLRLFYNDGETPYIFYFSCFCSSQPAADFNGDGWVTSSDLAHLLTSWGPCSGCDADLDGDGSVGAFDLATLLGSWGPCS